MTVTELWPNYYISNCVLPNVFVWFINFILIVWFDFVYIYVIVLHRTFARHIYSFPGFIKGKVVSIINIVPSKYILFYGCVLFMLTWMQFMIWIICSIFLQLVIFHPFKKFPYTTLVFFPLFLCVPLSLINYYSV